MSREAAARQKGAGRSRQAGAGSWWPRTKRARWAAVGLGGLPSVLAACGGGVGAGESQPTVFESAPPPSEQSPEVLTDEEEPVDPPDSSADDADQAEPIPASSEGPAENWPEPEIPEEIYEPTEEGAEALIQYWFDARHHARFAGDVESWRFASHEECDVCQVMIKRIEETYPSGWYVGDHDELVELHVGLDGDMGATGLLTLNQASFRSYWQGELYGETPPDVETTFSILLSFDDERWQASELTVLEGHADSSEERGSQDAS